MLAVTVPYADPQVLARAEVLGVFARRGRATSLPAAGGHSRDYGTRSMPQAAAVHGRRCSAGFAVRALTVIPLYTTASRRS